ncbi:hypothetical protein FPZ24_10440 [Sphingomonas panacisoli]|uniref:Uncharacterized protein n=2 Tax=Sphingomonas panacisoli TaxID=1813879 RepID=A0A5B8LIF5_9SPHN|nr:hypothetical protein FPZ24_10440 [Sphingomonas panacisoli]
MVAGLPSAAHAATCSWLTAAGNWATTGNWSCGVVPTGADDVVITIAGGTVSLTGAVGQASTLTLGSGNTLNVSGTDLIVGSTLTNNGTITFGGNARFRSGGTLNIDGTGTIALDNSGGYARIGEFGGTFNFGSGQTIRGQGELGFGQGTFSNAGLVSADISGATLVVDTAGGNGSTSFVNTGIMQATGGGILRFDGGGYDNSAGTIRAINGGTVAIANDARIIGGTLSNSTGGMLTTAPGNTSYLQNVTVMSGSNLVMGANSDILVNGALTINGTLTTAAATRLRAETANVTLNGTGDILLDNSVSYARIGEFGGNFTIAAGLTVHGAGELGFNNASFTNNGLVSADASGRTLVVDSAGNNGSTSFVNTAIMQATGGGTLRFDGGAYDNNAGVIRATNSGIVLINNDARIIGGTLTGNTGGTITTSGTSFLQNVTLSAGTPLNMGANSDIIINGTLTNNGTLNMGASTRLRAEGGGVVTINGTGNIVMNAGPGVYSRIGEFGGTFIFGSNQNVSGSGEIGFNNALIANNNLFTFAAGSNVNIDGAGGNGGVSGGLGAGGNAGFLNNGTILADNSSVHILGGLYDNQTGVMRAINGGTVEINNDARIVGGTLSTATGGTITTAGTSFLQNATLAAGSNLVMGANTDVLVNGTLTTNGTFRMAASTRLRAESAGAVTLNGTGDIILDNSAPGSYSRIGEFGGNFTLASGLTIHGQGEIGFNNASFTNSALISADVSGATLAIDPAGGNGTVSFINKAILQATNSGTLSIGGGDYDNATGIIRAVGNGTVILQNDARIIGGSLTSNTGGLITNASGQYFLQNTTLTAGSNLTMGAASDLLINGTLTVNGTLTTAGSTRLRAEGAGAVTINGTGNVILDSSAGYSRIGEFGGAFTFGSGLTVQGSGEIGFNNSILTNNGLISADAGTGMNLDVAGGSGGVSGGLGTSGIAGLFNTGTIQAANGKTMSVQGGLYENSATGTIGAIGADSQFVMNNDANLANLQAGNVLSLGNYVSSTTGAASTLSLRGTGANSIETIGTGGATTDTIVTLSGANSVFNVTNFNTGVNTTLDSTLTTVARSGRLNILGGRDFNVVGGSGSLTNNGIVQLGGGALTSTASAGTNTGLMTGFGSIGFNITNSGTVEAAGGTLATRTITGTTGTMRSNAGGTLDISGGAADSTTGFLTNNGNLTLGARSVTVTSDYQNANFGSGNAFVAHSNVSGSGLILAASATMDLSGPGLSGNTLNVGNVRLGTTSPRPTPISRRSPSPRSKSTMSAPSPNWRSRKSPRLRVRERSVDRRRTTSSTSARSPRGRDRSRPTSGCATPIWASPIRKCWPACSPRRVAPATPSRTRRSRA